MNSLSPAQEQAIHQLVQALFAPAQLGECKCHWIEADKTPILMWKSSKDPDTFILKISTQKFIGLTRSDKKGESYWKFKNVYEGTEVPLSPHPEPKSEEPKPSEPSPNPAPNVEQVQKFQAKYGNSANPK